MRKFRSIVNQNNLWKNRMGCYHTSRFLSQPIVKLPELGDSISSGVVAEICAEEGMWCPEDSVIYRVETDKILADIRMPEAGILKKLLQEIPKNDEEIEVGEDLFEYEKVDSAPEGVPVYGSESGEKPKQSEQASEPKAEAKKEAAPIKETASKPVVTKSSPNGVAPQASRQGSSGERRVPMSKMRKRIAERLKESQNTYALLTTFNEIDMSNAINLRNKYKDSFQEKYGIKMGFMGIFLKAAARALQDWPDVNAVIDGNDIVYRDYVDISVAVATPTGLIVPVVRNCESLSIPEIELEIQRLAKKGREGSITLQDMAGGSFTVSNGGVFGSMMGTPIVNPPQSAILGMHATKKRPVVVTENGQDKIEIRPVMFTALTYDHRLIDGSTAVRCLKQIGEYVENPEGMLL